MLFMDQIKSLCWCQSDIGFYLYFTCKIDRIFIHPRAIILVYVNINLPLDFYSSQNWLLI